jgi:hypothetical protein
MFIDPAGKLRAEEYYLEIGRRAMRASLYPQISPNDQFRLKVMDDAVWPRALALGPVHSLGPLVGLSADDVRVSLLIGDVFLISQWAEAMVEAGTQVQAMRALVKGSDLSSVTADPRFQNMRSALQRTLAGMVKASKVRFSEPWGMLCLYSAAGSPHTASAKIVDGALSLNFSPNLALDSDPE